MRLRVALKLLARPVGGRHYEWRRRRDHLGAILVPVRLRGNVGKAERLVVRARCQRGVHNLQPIDKFQTYAACVWCWDPATKTPLERYWSFRCWPRGELGRFVRMADAMRAWAQLKGLDLYHGSVTWVGPGDPPEGKGEMLRELDKMEQRTP